MDPTAIRKIIESIDNLTESRGLAARSPGTVFVDKATGESIIFNDIKFYPEEGGKFEPTELNKAVEQVQSSSPVKIEWENKPTARTGAFAIASFTKDGKPLLVGTYLQQIKSDPVANNVPNVVLGKYFLSSKASEKTRAGLMPQDLLSDKTNLTAESIVAQLGKKLGTMNPLYLVAKHVANGNPLPLEIPAPSGVSFSAFRDYFCEILQPIALQKGLYTGKIGNAERAFLAPQTFADTLISFEVGKNAGLSDSVLNLPDGRYVRISSKGSKGASAAVGNLLESINQLRLVPAGVKLLKKYKEVVEILQGISEAGQNGAPLFLGVKYGIITASEAQIIRGLRYNALVDITIPQELKDLGLTRNLIKLVNTRSPSNPTSVNIYYHLMAAVAHKAVVEVNTHTDFSDAASTILNNGALIQVYSKVTEKKDKWILSGFEAFYPGEAITGVKLSARKTYFSTFIKGNFTFDILRNGAEAPPEDVTDSVPTPVAKKSSGIKSDVGRERRSTITARTVKPGGAGRERR